MLNLDSPWLWVCLFGGALVLGTGFNFFARWCLYRPAVPLDKLNQLRVGMKMDEVRSLLGAPRCEVGGPDSPEWRYGHRLKFHALVVRFNKDGRITQFRHASREQNPATEQV